VFSTGKPEGFQAVWLPVAVPKREAGKEPDAPSQYTASAEPEGEHEPSTAWPTITVPSFSVAVMLAEGASAHTIGGDRAVLVTVYIPEPELTELEADSRRVMVQPPGTTPLETTATRPVSPPTADDRPPEMADTAVTSTPVV